MNQDAPELVVPVSANDHMQGHADATVTLVEYGDYQCPACGMAYPEIKKIQREFGADLRFVFRNFPLQEAHPLAQPAAEVAEAAALLHRFWPMHDWLYENQEAWIADGGEALEEGLRAVGLDEGSVVGSVRAQDVDKRIRADFMGGVHSGVNGTPCFFLNGYRFESDFRLLEATIASLVRES